MKKINPIYVILGLVALGGAIFFASMAFNTDNMYQLAWSIILVAVCLCFVTAPHYSNACSKVFSWFVIPASIICLLVGIFTPGKSGAIILALSFAGIGSGIGGLLLSVFLGRIAGTIVAPPSEVEYSPEKAREMAREFQLTEKKSTSDKDASVVGRAVVGGIIAGPAGAVVGAISAADKNNKNRSQNNK